MFSPAKTVNRVIINKYCWMSRQLRNCNDAYSIIHWSNAMLSIKMLLLQPHEAQTLNTLPPPTESADTSWKTHDLLTFSHKNTIDFLPAVEPRHTLSQTHSFNFLPQPPLPLSIFTPRELSIPPHTPPYDSQKPASKRRKTGVPPQVDYTAQPSQDSTIELQQRSHPLTPSVARLNSQLIQITTPATPHDFKETQAAQIRASVLELLEKKRRLGHLHWGDLHTPFWARKTVEARLHLAKQALFTLNDIKVIVIRTVNEFYRAHGRQILRWVKT